mgnify:CR=1 FL=1
MESEERKQKYNEYVERITPDNKLFTDVFNAFWIGGIICLMGQIWVAIFTYFGMNKEDAAAWTTLVLILESVILTGLNIYPKIAKKGGAGCLVPITGFANGVVAPAIEFKAEGQIWCWSKNIYHCRAGYFVWNIFQLDCGSHIHDTSGGRNIIEEYGKNSEEEIPLGLGFELAMNDKAMESFSKMPEGILPFY